MVGKMHQLSGYETVRSGGKNVPDYLNIEGFHHVSGNSKRKDALKHSNNIYGFQCTRKACISRQFGASFPPLLKFSTNIKSYW